MTTARSDGNRGKWGFANCGDGGVSGRQGSATKRIFSRNYLIRRDNFPRLQISANIFLHKLGLCSIFVLPRRRERQVSDPPLKSRRPQNPSTRKRALKRPCPSPPRRRPLGRSNPSPRCALPSPLKARSLRAARPEMAPQTFENPRFAEGNGAPEGAASERAAMVVPTQSLRSRRTETSAASASAKPLRVARKRRRKGLKRLNPRPEMVWPRQPRTPKI